MSSLSFKTNDNRACQEDFKAQMHAFINNALMRLKKQKLVKQITDWKKHSHLDSLKW